MFEYRNDWKKVKKYLSNEEKILTLSFEAWHSFYQLNPNMYDIDDYWYEPKLKLAGSNRKSDNFLLYDKAVRSKWDFDIETRIEGLYKEITRNYRSYCVPYSERTVKLITPYFLENDLWIMFERYSDYVKYRKFLKKFEKHKDDVTLYYLKEAREKYMAEYINNMKKLNEEYKEKVKQDTIDKLNKICDETDELKQKYLKSVENNLS